MALYRSHLDVFADERFGLLPRREERVQPSLEPGVRFCDGR